MTTTVPPVTRPPDIEPPEPAPPGRRRRSIRSRSERRLGWMLCAPAVIVMLLVTAYPIVYAIILSLQRNDLRFPDQAQFVGLRNYAD
ncbi:MAG: trehalose/maltose transport system permease protein, partial [Actinomycetota bacterium]|nr:trehalose/maltose transport system permease protein [Actinomycetota bacterium]